MSAAALEFPRGWNAAANQQGTGVPTSIGIPAIPGTANTTPPGTHVLTSVSADVTIFQGVAVIFGSVVQVSLDGGVTFIPLFTLQVTANVATAGSFSGKDSGSWSGQWAAQAGQSLIVEFAGAIAGASEFLTIEGYDI